MKYIIAVDIGGTTFNTGILTESLDIIFVSDKDKIRYYSNREKIAAAISSQIETSINNNNIDKNDIIGIGVASPGPLDSKKGIILNTPNLKTFQNFKIADYFNKKFGIQTFLENDANLFALGEWYSSYKKKNTVLGVTLGTGLGFGFVINGKLFKGENGMAMEYGLSPYEWGICEKNVCLEYIRKRGFQLYGEIISPREIENNYKNNDRNAIDIYNDFGKNLGIVLSHLVNMIDPGVIVIGGGLSKAFDCFSNSMLLSLEQYVSSFESRSISISPSKYREKSAMIGSGLIVRNNC